MVAVSAPQNTGHVRHFLTLNDLSKDELNSIIDRAIEMKKELHEGRSQPLLERKVMGMIFEKSSTRTRVSFETGMAQLGGHALFLSPRDTQLGRGEPIEDSARVLSRMVDIVMIRTFGHDKIERFAEYSQVPVINALTDDYHPCQLLADIQTFVELRGSMEGKIVAWVGDGNNMCNSYINAAALCGFELRIACPKGFEPAEHLLQANRDCVTLCATPQEAVAGAHLVVTDTWASMGQEEEKNERERAFADYQVNAELMSHAAADALFMHCLPAYRGKEVSAELLDAPDSAVWQEAENRLHAQKALVEFLLTQ
ncbi:ornithine carbamoyltransferase [Gilvimarinus xylanilyticus]|uniref:Ornithine carbamoyltransferase n=1 Tax=Gilvimarinus xylanilyticus TaxID=2944139 RepID=A0A9X2HYQ5_9GAMM|nr:ornithine carbamoyltransferase [Gilvimarinus xylanilyticus]MCP8898936.1 ornithine carbamoyltransferase [Gilvimarinus xylanilyticus]